MPTQAGAWSAPAVALLVALLVVGPVASQPGSPVAPECLGLADASGSVDGSGRPIPNDACLGTVGGEDAADWYRVETADAVALFVRYCVRDIASGAELAVEMWWTPFFDGEPGMYLWQDVLTSGCIGYYLTVGEDGPLGTGTLFFHLSGTGAPAVPYSLFYRFDA